MHVLLTGGAGYIGAHTCVELLKEGYKIVVADNYVNSQPEALKRVQALAGIDFPVYDVDLCDKEAFRKVFEEQKIDVVIHFAGLKAVGESVEKPLLYYRNNLDASLTLFELMHEYGVKKIVFSSSATVYGEVGTVEYTEDLPTGNSSSPYGQTKCMIEQMLKDASVAYPDWSVVLLRYFNPVGAHESGMIGEDPNGIPNNLMPRVMQAALGIIDPFGIYGDDYETKDGTCVRDYIHVVDLAKGHAASLDYLNKFTGVEAVNLGTGVGYSVLDILNTFERVNGIKINSVVVPRRPGDLAAYYANPEKARELLRWKAEKTLEDMCRDAWHWQKNNPNGY